MGLALVVDGALVALHQRGAHRRLDGRLGRYQHAVTPVHRRLFLGVKAEGVW